MGISSLVYMHVLSNGWTAIKFVLIKSSLTLSVCKAGSIYVTVGCSSVCLFHRAPCGQEISIDSCMRSVVSVQEARSVARAGAQQQMRAASRWQPTDEAEHRLVNFDLWCNNVGV